MKVNYHSIFNFLVLSDLVPSRRQKMEEYDSAHYISCITYVYPEKCESRTKKLHCVFTIIYCGLQSGIYLKEKAVFQNEKIAVITKFGNKLVLMSICHK